MERFSVLFRLYVQGWTRLRALELVFVLFLPLSIGVSADGSCFDVFGYTDELNI